ncbi:MAG TPA: GNAT family protein [Flavisolibacter sp.]|nr:GNAT family protein [Flavisolibacter sp.]
MLSPNFSPFPVLETDRLILRQVTINDAAPLFFLRSSEEVMKYIDRPKAATLQDAVDLIYRLEDVRQKNDGINWGITLKGKDEVIGTIALFHLQKENYRGEIGYLLHPLHQGKGIMKEAIKKVLDYGFSVIQLHSVEATTNVNNEISQKLLESVGFLREAYFRENYFYNGQFMDSAIYCLLAPQ